MAGALRFLWHQDNQVCLNRLIAEKSVNLNLEFMCNFLIEVVLGCIITYWCMGMLLTYVFIVIRLHFRQISGIYSLYLLIYTFITLRVAVVLLIFMQCCGNRLHGGPGKSNDMATQ